MSRAAKTPAPAAPKTVHTSMRWPVALHATVARKAKAAKRTFGAQVISMVDVQQRLAEAMAALPPSVALGTAAAPSMPAPAADSGFTPGDTWQLLLDIHTAVRDPDAHCVIPSSIGRRLEVMLKQGRRLGS